MTPYAFETRIKERNIDIENYVSLYKKGVDYNTLSSITGYSPKTTKHFSIYLRKCDYISNEDSATRIRNVYKKNADKLKIKTAKRNNYIEELFLANESEEKIAASLGVSKSVVLTVLKRKGYSRIYERNDVYPYNLIKKILNVKDLSFLENIDDSILGLEYILGFLKKDQLELLNLYYKNHNTFVDISKQCNCSRELIRAKIRKAEAFLSLAANQVYVRYGYEKYLSMLKNKDFYTNELGAIYKVAEQTFPNHAKYLLENAGIYDLRDLKDKKSLCKIINKNTASYKKINTRLIELDISL